MNSCYHYDEDMAQAINDKCTSLSEAFMDIYLQPYRSPCQLLMTIPLSEAFVHFVPTFSHFEWVFINYRFDPNEGGNS